MSEEQVQQQPEQKPIEIEVDPQVAFNLKLQEYDKAIAIAEAQVYDFKKQKMSFIYDQNVQVITEAAMAKKKNEKIPDANVIPMVESK